MLKGEYQLGKIKFAKTKSEDSKEYKQLEFVYLGGSFWICDFLNSKVEIGKKYNVLANPKGWGNLDLISLEEVKEK